MLSHSADKRSNRNLAATRSYKRGAVKTDKEMNDRMRVSCQRDADLTDGEGIEEMVRPCDATMKGTGQAKTRLPPTRSFVHWYCRCCCCCWCCWCCRRCRNATMNTTGASTKGTDLSQRPPYGRHNRTMRSKSPRLSRATSNSRGVSSSTYVLAACLLSQRFSTFVS